MWGSQTGIEDRGSGVEDRGSGIGGRAGSEVGNTPMHLVFHTFISLKQKYQTFIHKTDVFFSPNTINRLCQPNRIRLHKEYQGNGWVEYRTLDYRDGLVKYCPLV